jgi:hypothetical protein
MFSFPHDLLTFLGLVSILSQFQMMLFEDLDIGKDNLEEEISSIFWVFGVFTKSYN